MTQQKIKELLIKTFGEEEANNPDVVRLYADCLRQAVNEVVGEQSLLDDFAKAAMQAIIGTMPHPQHPNWGGKEGAAYHAYEIATLMMKERERRMKG